MRDNPITAREVHTDLIHCNSVLDAIDVIKVSIGLLPDSGFERLNVENALAWITGYIEATKRPPIL